MEDRRVHIYPGNYEDYLFRKQGGVTKLATEAAKNPHIDHATGMFKPSRRCMRGTTGLYVRVGNENAHGSRIGSLAPVLPSKPPVKRLNPIKLKHLETRVAELEI